MKEQQSNPQGGIKEKQLHVLSMANGFYNSSILFALLKLRVFERIGKGNKSVDELASELKTRPETLARLLKAGVVLKLLTTADGKHFEVAAGYHDVLLPSSGDNYLGNFIRNLDYVQQAMSRLDQAVLNSAPTIDPATLLGADKERTREFILAMHNYASLHGKELSNALNTDRCLKLLDLGCGPGTYAFNLGLLNPDLELYLLDLPETLEVTREIQTELPLKNKIHYLPLDVIKDEIPGSFDMILVSNMLHMLEKNTIRELIKRLFYSVNNGGALVIQAQFIREDRPMDQWPVFMDMVQLCCTAEGGNHSVEETKRWMQDAGFVDIDFNSMSVLNINSFLICRKPA